mmetsp:Transcript_14365/g.31127  ORF Transcript_14365/g.31127 Transcript_14365/m.31127 type:complete len:205 (-) Transcript_14365:21-635(-)
MNHCLNVHPQSIHHPDHQVELPIQAGVLRELAEIKAHATSHREKGDVHNHHDKAEQGIALGVSLIGPQARFDIWPRSISFKTLTRPVCQLHLWQSWTGLSSLTGPGQDDGPHQGRDESDAEKKCGEEDIPAVAVIGRHHFHLVNRWEESDMPRQKGEVEKHQFSRPSLILHLDGVHDGKIHYFVRHYPDGPQSILPKMHKLFEA